MSLVFGNMNDAYPTLIQLALEHGERMEPREYVCYELRPCNFTILDPRRTIYGGLSRKLSARFWAIETLSYAAGFGDQKWHADLLVRANKGMAGYLNETTGKFDGAYGTRIRKSLEDIIQLLRRDPDTRQAVCSIWSPGLPKDSKDVPCTIALHFFRSRGKLALQVTMRSNDLNWGLPYDIPAFCAIQLYVASRLKWDVGEYHHSCGSLHVYENETGEKGRPGPPKILSPNEETWEDREVPVLDGLGWIEPSLRTINDYYEANDGAWLEYGYMGKPWAGMIGRNSWLG